MKASWNNIVIAESDDTVLVEGNYYLVHSRVAFGNAIQVA